MVEQISPLKITAGYDDLKPETIARNLSHLFHTWKLGYPLYCVRESLLEDMLATDVGENLALFESIELNMPCFALFFPTNKVRSPFGGFIDYLIINHEQIDTREHKHLISWGCIDSDGMMILSAKRIRRDGTLMRSHFASEDNTQKERALIIRNIVLQSILLLQHYPQVVEEYKPETSNKKGFGASPKHESKYQLPRWLGEYARISHRYGGTGSGSGKRTHFRRGHWRLIKGERLVHVRPAWVNGLAAEIPHERQVQI